MCGRDIEALPTGAGTRGNPTDTDLTSIRRAPDTQARAWGFLVHLIGYEEASYHQEAPMMSILEERLLLCIGHVMWLPSFRTLQRGWSSQ